MNAKLERLILSNHEAIMQALTVINGDVYPVLFAPLNNTRERIRQIDHDQKRIQGKLAD